LRKALELERQEIIHHSEGNHMTDDLLANALKKKRQGYLEKTEVQQLEDLRTAYGTHQVLIAIQFASTTQIKEVGRMLLQHCGFRSGLGVSLKELIPDKETARQKFPPDKYLAGCRLAEATTPVEPELENHAKILWTHWKAKLKGSDSSQTQVIFALKPAIRMYGVAFAQMGIDVLSKTPKHAESQLVMLYKGWLEVASSSISVTIQSRLKEMGISPDGYDWEIPQPVPYRLEKYFTAKANRIPSQEERVVLWSKSQRHPIEEIIHAMSSIPSSEFCIQKVKDLLSRNEPFGVEFVAANNKKKTVGMGYEEEEDKGWKPDENEYEEIQLPHDPMRDSSFYDYSRYDENALDSEGYLVD
jgi:hypothetical protein